MKAVSPAVAGSPLRSDYQLLAPLSGVSGTLRLSARERIPPRLRDRKSQIENLPRVAGPRLRSGNLKSLRFRRMVVDVEDVILGDGLHAQVVQQAQKLRTVIRAVVGDVEQHLPQDQVLIFAL